MKASEYIKLLQNAIDKHGDCDVMSGNIDWGEISIEHCLDDNGEIEYIKRDDKMSESLGGFVL